MWYNLILTNVKTYVIIKKKEVIVRQRLLQQKREKIYIN